MDIKYFKNVDFNTDYLETRIEFQNREIELDINTDVVLGKDSWVKEYEEYISKLEIFKEKIDKEIVEDFENDGITKEWVDFHLEELGEAIEEERLLERCDKKLSLDRQVLSIIKLRRIGIYPEYEDYAIWDYILDDEISDEILVIVTDKNGEIVDITWES
ncbi:MAG: DUF2004 domain-containing protein [Fusobacterium perfoetens]|uniref:DUF2004 domain-containing protein n=1 Tax=Fusobacterium perfoetens TaxID=852 RepID=UPI0023EF893A|nr:DUF2004 domain-containing protein [Fusobacterium perfoetens]MCI6152011.1 DUF2004 domain-containing protein [Fusobacterium perfoetens]MDY3238098.1 DUF2004 domain-containing protein [Fusobacterium perfoetens]